MKRSLGAFLQSHLVVFRHWPPLSLLLVGTLLAQMAYAIITPTLPLFLRSGRLHTPIAAIGLIFAAYAIAETLFKAPAGAAGDKWGRTRIALIGLMLGTVSPILMTMAWRWEFFVPLRAMDGLGVALVWPTVMALIGEKVPRQDRALAMSAFNLPYLGGMVLGMSAGLQIGHFTGDNRHAFYTSSGLLLCAAVCLIATAVWDRRLGGRWGPAARPEPLPLAVQGEAGDLLDRGWWQRLRLLSRRRSTLLHMLWIFVFVQMGASLLVPILTLYARDFLHMSQAEMVKLFVVPGLLTALAAIPLGRLVDRTGRPRAIRVGLVLGAVGLSLTAAVGGHAWLVAILMALLGISYVVVMPAWMALTSELAPPGRQGLALGAMNTAQGLGFVVATLAGALLYERIAPTAPFYGGAALLALCAVACMFLVRDKRPSEDEG
jgi:DHA1 family multidrug resistance protein-like MFS transporter